jgi:hypothetical protein
LPRFRSGDLAGAQQRAIGGGVDLAFMNCLMDAVVERRRHPARLPDMAPATEAAIQVFGGEQAFPVQR